MTSINNMVKRVTGLADTKDVNEWENNFIKSIVIRTDNGKSTASLTERQVESLEDLFYKHFSG